MKKLLISSITLAAAVTVSVVSIKYFLKPLQKIETLNYGLPEEVKKLVKEKKYFNEKQKEKISQLLFQPSNTTKSMKAALSAQGTLSELHSDLERIKSERPKEMTELIMALESYKLRLDLHETQISNIGDKDLEEAKEFLSEINIDIQKIVTQSKESNNLDLKQLNELLDRLPQPETNTGHRAAPITRPSNDYPVKSTSLQNLSFFNQAYAALPFGCQTNYQANSSNENHLSASFLNINESLVAPTPEILEVTRKLTKAEEIFKFVRDNIHYYPTFGFTQPARAVMDSKKGNPFDQSTLLISLLRSAGIPARYVIGEVWISTETLKKLWNIEDEQDIWYYYASIQNKRFNDLVNVNSEKIYRYVNGSIHYLLPHAWVETYTKPENSNEERWIQLDPSFVLHEENKKHELVNKVFDIANNLNINIFTYEDFFFQPDSTGKIIKRETADIFAARKMNAVINYAQTNNYSWDKKLTTFFNKIQFDMNQKSVFPYGPHGEETCILDKFALPSSKYFPKVKFGFEGTEHTVQMADFAGKMVNIRYRGATSVDRSKLDLHAKGQYTGSLSDIKLIAQLYVDNKVIKESSNIVSFGPHVNFTMDFVDTNGMVVPETNQRGTSRGGVFAYNNSVIPESQAVFDREIQKFNEEINKVEVQALNFETKSRLASTLLSTGTMRLKLDEEIHHNNISELFNGKVLHPGLHYTFRSGFSPVVFKDRNYGFSPDIPILSIDGVWTAWGNHPSSKTMGAVAYAFGSQQEHQIMENHFNVPGRSSVFILQYAKENGIPIVATNFDPNNIDSILGQLVGYGTSRIDFYRKEMQKVKAGFFYAPKYPVNIQNINYYVIFFGGFNGGGAALIGTEKGGAGGPASADTGIGYTTTEIGDWLANNGSTIGRNSQQIPHIQNGENVNGCAVGQPVNLNNGGMWHKFQDISPIGDGPGVKASFARTYLAKRSNDFSTLGYGWTHNLNLYLKSLNGSALDINQNQDIIFFDGDGNENLITFENNNFQILPFRNLSYKKENGNFILTDRDLNVMTFHGSGIFAGKIKEIKDRNANTLSFTYDLATRHLMGVQDRTGRSINLTYQNGMLKKVSDFTGRSVSFTHDTNGDLTQSIDVLSNKTVYTYYNGLSPIELNHNLKSFKNEKGEGVEYFYYKNDKVFKHIEPEGKITTFLYDTYNKQTSVINGKEERTIYRYDIFGNILSMEQPDRSIKDFKYDLYRNKTYEKDENNFVTTYKTDSRGNITEIAPPAPFGKTVISYDPKYNVPNLVTDGKGNKTIYGIDPQNGNIRSIKQYPNSGKELLTQITYNDQGEITSIIDPKQNALTIERTQNTDKSKLITITNAEGETMTREIDPLGQVVKATDLNGIETSLTYNNLGLPVSSSTPQASINQTFSYDKSNNLIGVAREVEGKTLTSSYIHDGLGNIIEATNERGETYKISYQQSGCGCTEESLPKQIIDPKGGITKLEHDWRGNVIQKIDPMGIKTRLNYDPRGSLTAVTVFNTNESISSQINFTYGPLNLLKEKSEIVGYATVLNRNTFKTSDPVKDMIVKTIYNFDPAGNLSEKVVTRPATGEVAKTSYSYNGLNLLTGISSTGYKHNVSKTLNYDDASNLTQITQNKTKLALQYDGANRPILVQTIADTTGVVKQPSSTLNYTYTPGGQITSIKDAVGAEIVGYELDELMRPRLVKSGKFSIGIEFDSLGRKKQISYPNKLETTFSFDNFERLAEISTPDLGFRSYDYDPLSNISQIKFESGQLDYAYDRNSSIIGSYYRGAEAIKDELFVWDASGNRLNGTQAPRTPSIRPRPIVINNGLFEDAEPMGEQVGRYSMIYDLHGNVTKKFDNQENIYYVFEYDADNKLVYAEKYKNDSLLLKARYTFDGLGRRIEKEITKGSTVTRKSYIYNGDDILLEYNTSSSTPIETARYIGTGDIDDNLMVIKNGKAYFYHKDHLGSIVAITDDAGEVVQKNQYSSFGKILSIKDKNRKEIGIEGATEKSFAYTGREWDEEIDLYYYRARHYDPIEGRFIQKDPIGLDAGDPNIYRYVQNNAINFTDPLGLLSFENNLARRRLSNSGNSIAKSLTSLALGGVFAKRYGTVTILEALRYRLSIATLGGSVGTVGSVAATTALNSLFIGASFELGQEAGNILGALLDTLVDDLQGGPEIDSSLSKSLTILGFGSGQPNAPKSACEE